MCIGLVMVAFVIVVLMQVKAQVVHVCRADAVAPQLQLALSI